MKYITVKLTEDQARATIKSLEAETSWLERSNQKNVDRRVAFNKRTIQTISAELVKL